MTPAIRCRDLRKTYAARPPVEAIRGVDLEIPQGACFGLLGPNGAGKTTTVEILEGILEPTAGDVEILGLRWGKDDHAIREKIGVSLQETKLADKLTVEETITLFGSFYKSGRQPQEVMAEVGLTEKRASWVTNLSGGQRQRLAVACALVGDPALLFLDEPTTGLDPQSRRQIWEIVRDLRCRGRTILLTTHYMDEAERLCDHVAVVDHGRVIALGSPAELISSLGGEHVVEFAVNGGGFAENGAAEAETRDGSRVTENGMAATERSIAATEIGDVSRIAGKSMPSAVGGDGAAGGVIDMAALSGIPSVKSARADASGFQLTVAEPHVAIPALLDLLARDGRALSRLTTRHASLEDVFVSLTGRHLRDE